MDQLMNVLFTIVIKYTQHQKGPCAVDQAYVG